MTAVTYVEGLRLGEPCLVPAELGRRHHLHGLGDLGDVLGGVDAHHDLLLRRHPSSSHAAFHHPHHQQYREKGFHVTFSSGACKFKVSTGCVRIDHDVDHYTNFERRLGLQYKVLVYCCTYGISCGYTTTTESTDIASSRDVETAMVVYATLVGKECMHSSSTPLRGLQRRRIVDVLLTAKKLISRDCCSCASTFTDNTTPRQSSAAVKGVSTRWTVISYQTSYCPRREFTLATTALVGFSAYCTVITRAASYSFSCAFSSSTVVPLHRHSRRKDCFTSSCAARAAAELVPRMI